jgi:branched-chain amino acid transport system permease protein
MHELAGNLAMGPQRLMEIARACAPTPRCCCWTSPPPACATRRSRPLAACCASCKAEGMSILLVEHDMDFVMDLTDHIVVMEFGTLLTEGTPRGAGQPRRARGLPGNGTLT